MPIKAKSRCFRPKRRTRFKHLPKTAAQEAACPSQNVCDVSPVIHDVAEASPETNTSTDKTSSLEKAVIKYTSSEENPQKIVPGTGHHIVCDGNVSNPNQNKVCLIQQRPFQAGILLVTEDQATTNLPSHTCVSSWKTVAEMLRQVLPDNYSIRVSQDSLSVLVLSKGENIAIQRSVSFQNDGNFKVTVHGKRLDDDHDLLKTLPFRQIPLPCVTDTCASELSDKIVKTMTALKEFKVCVGAPEEHFEALWPTVRSAHVEEGYYDFRFNRTFRSDLCLYLVDNRAKRCASCMPLYKNLYLKYTRRGGVVQRTPYKFNGVKSPENISTEKVPISEVATSDRTLISMDHDYLSKNASNPATPVSDLRQPVSILKKPATSKLASILKKPAPISTSTPINMRTIQQTSNQQQPEEPAPNSTSTPINKPTNQQTINQQQPEEPAPNSTSTLINKPTNQQTINQQQPEEPAPNSTSTPRALENPLQVICECGVYTCKYGVYKSTSEQQPEDVVLQDIQNRLPPQWRVFKGSGGLHITLHSRDAAYLTQRSLFVTFATGQVEMFAHGHQLLPNQSITPFTAATRHSFIQEVSSLIQRIRQKEICIGINRPEFKVWWASCLDTCCIDYNDFHETRYSTTLRSNDCEYLIDQPKKFCNSCQKINAKFLRRKPSSKPTSITKKKALEPCFSMSPPVLECDT